MKTCSALFSSLRRGILPVVLLLATSLPAWAQPASTSSQSSTSIRTPDFEESVRWYQEKLGFRLIASQNFVQGRSAVLERSGFLLEIAEADHILAHAQEPHATGGFEVTRVPVISVLVPDVDKEIQRLREGGVEVLQDPQDELDGRYRTAEIRDNGRHRIELREPIDENGFYSTGR